MIQLTRLNSRPLIVNSELIEFIENAPDTVITLVTGEKIVVRESAEEIIELILGFRRRLLPGKPVVLPHVISGEDEPTQDRRELKDSSDG